MASRQAESSPAPVLDGFQDFHNAELVRRIHGNMTIVSLELNSKSKRPIVYNFKDYAALSFIVASDQIEQLVSDMQITAQDEPNYPSFSEKDDELKPKDYPSEAYMRLAHKGILSRLLFMSGRAAASTLSSKQNDITFYDSSLDIIRLNEQVTRPFYSEQSFRELTVSGDNPAGYYANAHFRISHDGSLWVFDKNTIRRLDNHLKQKVMNSFENLLIINNEAEIPTATHHRTKPQKITSKFEKAQAAQSIANLVDMIISFRSNPNERSYEKLIKVDLNQLADSDIKEKVEKQMRQYNDEQRHQFIGRAITAYVALAAFETGNSGLEKLFTHMARPNSDPQEDISGVVAKRLNGRGGDVLSPVKEFKLFRNLKIIKNIDKKKHAERLDKMGRIAEKAITFSAS